MQWFEGTEGLKHLADVGSVGITLGAITGLLPTLSALLAVVWMGIRVYETRTVQRLLGREVKADD